MRLTSPWRGTRMAPRPRPKPKGEVDMVEPFVRGRAKVKEFYDVLEQATDTPADHLKRIFTGLQKVAVRDLKEKSMFTIPGMGVFRRVTKPAAAEAPMAFMGKNLTRREKPATCKVVCKAAPALNDKVVE